MKCTKGRKDVIGLNVIFLIFSVNVIVLWHEFCVSLVSFDCQRITDNNTIIECKLYIVRCTCMSFEVYVMSWRNCANTQKVTDRWKKISLSHLTLINKQKNQLNNNNNNNNKCKYTILCTFIKSGESRIVY